MIKRAQAGEEVLIANRGKPAVRLLAVAGKTKTGHRIGSPEALAAVMAANPRTTPRMAKEEIDAYITEERASWD